MARPRRRTRPSVTLLPFLSVLACVIGTLTLVITATATSQLASGGIDVERYERLEQEIETNRRRLAELTDLSAEIEELAADLVAARARAESLLRESSATKQALTKNVPLRESLRAENARVQALERELAPLAKSREHRRAALADRKRQLASAKIHLQPAGSGYGLDAHIVECRPEGIVYYAGLARTPRKVATHRIAGSPEYRRFLRAAVFRKNATIVFLIRQGGVDTCEWARSVARQHGLRHGEIPLASDGELDFSALSGS